jgi:hypothetical protein
MSDAHKLLSSPPHAQTDRVIEEFCLECHRVHDYWQVLIYLSDRNPDVEALKTPHYDTFFFVICRSLYESFVQGVARLHDKGFADTTLTVNYIVDKIQWDTATKAKLDDLSQKMTPFVEKIRSARHKFTAHNDLSTALNQPVIGAFDKGNDDEYFALLAEFASTAQRDLFPIQRAYPERCSAFYDRVRSRQDQVALPWINPI